MNEHKPEPWEEEFDREHNVWNDITITPRQAGNLAAAEVLENYYRNTGKRIKDFIRTLLANQNTANAERIRELKIVPASTPHGSPYITGVNETAEAAARIVEKQTDTLYCMNTTESDKDFKCNKEDTLAIIIEDNGTARTIEYRTRYLSTDVKLPTRSNGGVSFNEEQTKAVNALVETSIAQAIADQNAANAERIRELKIVPASTPHGSPYITGVNETAEAAARIVEVHK